jgi:hypothetical protein
MVGIWITSTTLSKDILKIYKVPKLRKYIYDAIMGSLRSVVPNLYQNLSTGKSLVTSFRFLRPGLWVEEVLCQNHWVVKLF